MGNTQQTQASAQPESNAPQTSTSSTRNPQREAALAKPISFYQQKAATTHEAIYDIWKGMSFTDAAEKYGKTQEELGQAFAVFGVQALNTLKDQGVNNQTTHLAMGFNKDGYGQPMVDAVPRAFKQKRQEARARWEESQAAEPGGKWVERQRAIAEYHGQADQRVAEQISAEEEARVAYAALHLDGSGS